MPEEEMKRETKDETASSQAEGEALDGTEEQMAEEAEHPSQEKPLDGRSKDEKKPVFGQQSTGFKGPGIGARIQHFIADAKRIFHVSRKPDRKEFTGMLKITALGIVLIGIIGFIIHFIFAFLGL